MKIKIIVISLIICLNSFGNNLLLMWDKNDTNSLVNTVIYSCNDLATLNWTEFYSYSSTNYTSNTLSIIPYQDKEFFMIRNSVTLFGVDSVGNLTTNKVYNSNSLSNTYTLNLTWNPSPSPEVIGYNIYINTGNAGYVINVGNNTSATINNLLIGTKYKFTATAYTQIGIESEGSNEVLFIMPKDPSKLLIFNQ